MTGQMTERDYKKYCLAANEELNLDVYPELGNLSAAFIYKFVPKPAEILNPEFVYVTFDSTQGIGNNKTTELLVTIAEWNILWEAGQLRINFFTEKGLPTELKWIEDYSNVNLYLLPNGGGPKYDIFKPLFHLIPKHTLQRFDLPLLKRGIWPPLNYDRLMYSFLNKNFDNQLAIAFANHVWPFLNSGSPIYAFSKDDPIVLLSHNLNYWLPHAYKVAENRLREYGRVDFEEKGEQKELKSLRENLPPDIEAERPLHGGSIWLGEDDANEATKEMVEIADHHGQLRSIIDAVKSNRIEDDFSDIWSFAKEDFERKLYQKRSKVKVSFVELDSVVPVHAPTSELHEDLIWEDFFTILDKKERHVVVCLKKGITQVGEISRRLGYANHSPVSKSLAKIRKKAKKFLEE